MRKQMMKLLNNTMLFIFVTLYAMCTGSTVYAESDSPGGNKTPTGLFGWAQMEVKGERGFHLNFDVSGSYGPMSGYTQTPLGGAPSSISDKRPKLDELGIDMMTMVNLSLSGGMDSHYVYGAAHLVDLKGESTLDKNLIFHGRQYPAGTRVNSEVNLSWYDIGYQYNIHLGRELMNLRMAPTVAFTPWDFSAELESNGGKNSRSYIKGTPRVGLEFEWFPVRRFYVSGKAIGSLPFNNMPHIYTVGLTGKYNLMNMNRLKVLLFMGVEYNQIDFKDSQTEPNRVKVKMGPLGLVGAETKF
jgi:hypothetical protein